MLHLLSRASYNKETEKRPTDVQRLFLRCLRDGGARYDNRCRVVQTWGPCGHRRLWGKRWATICRELHVHAPVPIPLSADSTVLAHVMKILNDRYDYGLDLYLLSIDEGISGYRDDSLEVTASSDAFSPRMSISQLLTFVNCVRADGQAEQNPI